MAARWLGEGGEGLGGMDGEEVALIRVGWGSGGRGLRGGRAGGLDQVRGLCWAPDTQAAIGPSDLCVLGTS